MEGAVWVSRIILSSGLRNGEAAVVERGSAKGSQGHLRGSVDVGQAESSGEGPRGRI